MDRQSDTGEWWMLIVFDLDIPSLTEQTIQLGGYGFESVKQLNSSSMNE